MILDLLTSRMPILNSKPKTHKQPQRASMENDQEEDDDDKKAVLLEALRQQGNNYYKQGECQCNSLSLTSKQTGRRAVWHGHRTHKEKASPS